MWDENRAGFESARRARVLCDWAKQRRLEGLRFVTLAGFARCADRKKIARALLCGAQRSVFQRGIARPKNPDAVAVEAGCDDDTAGGARGGRGVVPGTAAPPGGLVPSGCPDSRRRLPGSLSSYTIIFLPRSDSSKPVSLAAVHLPRVPPLQDFRPVRRVALERFCFRGDGFSGVAMKVPTFIVRGDVPTT